MRLVGRCLQPLALFWPDLVAFRGIFAMPDFAFGPFLTDAGGNYAYPLAIPANWVLDRTVWAQYFTFPGGGVPLLGSNPVSFVIKS
ncbi:MAG: hypothetical protein R3F56_07560 [Planctomycetota bacterium]